MQSRSAVLFASAIFAACSSSGGKGGPAKRPPPLVTVTKASVRDVPVEVRAPIDVRPLEQADVSSKTLGYLDAVFVDRGDPVKKGQLLALVRPSDLPDQLAAARSALAQSQAAVVLARANKERAEQLAPKGIVSQQELQQAVSAQAQAEANLASAQAQASAVAVRLGETRIESPLDGVVAQRRLDPGVLVGPTAGTGSLLTVERVDTVRVFIPINERDVVAIKVGEDAHVELDAISGKSFQGKVVRITPSLDPLTRTIEAEIQLPNPQGELRPGMYGRGSIITAVHPNAVVVPAGAVQISNDRHYVYVLNGDKVRRLEVAIGVDGGNWLEIASGLAPDAEVVTAGTDTLADNSPVRVKRNVDPFTGSPAVSETRIPPQD